MGIPAPIAAHSEGTAFRDRYRLHGKRLLTLFGYVTPNKGYELVADVLRGLPADVMLVIAGGARRPIEEQYVQYLKKRLRELGVEKRVVVTGYLTDPEVADAMKAADIA